MTRISAPRQRCRGYRPDAAFADHEPPPCIEGTDASSPLPHSVVAQVYVGPFVRRPDRPQDKKFTNVYVKNLAETITDEKLKELFTTYGAITSAVVMKNADGKSKGFGFINFETAEAAQAAVEAMEGKEIEGKNLNGEAPTTWRGRATLRCIASVRARSISRAWRMWTSLPRSVSRREVVLSVT